MGSKHRRQGLTLALLSLLVFGLGLQTDLAADSKKKKKKQTSSASSAVSEVLEKVDRRILGYDTPTARELLEPVIEEKDPRVDLAMGRILMLEKSYPEATARLTKASKDMDDPTPLLYLGETYVYAGKASLAEETFQQTAEKAQARLAAEPSDAGALYCLGVAQQRLKQYDAAVQSLERAKAAEPKNELIPFQLGLTQMLRNDYQAAFDQLDRAVQLNSGFAYAYYYRALAADRINRKDLLVNDLDRFLALAPNSPEAPKARKILEAARG